MSAASAMYSESSSGYDNGIPHNGRTGSDMSTEIADKGAANPDDKSTDADDETENLKIFKRVHMLQKPHSSAPPGEDKTDRNDVDSKNQPRASTETIEEVRRKARTHKLNELLRFSQTFKLKTPMPRELIGIITKDPAKQAQLYEKSRNWGKEDKMDWGRKGETDWEIEEIDWGEEDIARIENDHEVRSTSL